LRPRLHLPMSMVWPGCSGRHDGRHTETLGMGGDCACTCHAFVVGRVKAKHGTVRAHRFWPSSEERVRGAAGSGAGRWPFGSLSCRPACPGWCREPTGTAPGLPRQHCEQAGARIRSRRPGREGRGRVGDGERLMPQLYWSLRPPEHFIQPPHRRMPPAQLRRGGRQLIHVVMRRPRQPQPRLPRQRRRLIRRVQAAASATADASRPDRAAQAAPESSTDPGSPRAPAGSAARTPAAADCRARAPAR
jgi:hypothetical protein